MQTILEHAYAASQDSNVYFSAHLFGERSTRKGSVLPSKTIQADLDHADTVILPVLPTVLVRTSPGRHQAYWVSSQEYTTDALETIARRIAYGVQDCDPSGWSAGHRVRLPGTKNYKYPVAADIEIASVNLRALDSEIFNNFPENLVELSNSLLDIDWINETPSKIDIGPQALLESIRGQLPAKIYTQYNYPVKDRSAALWALTSELFKLNLSRDQIYWLVSHSKNNKFDDRKYHAVVDLRKDILRAERFQTTRRVDLKLVLMDLRIAKNLSAAEKKRSITQVVINHMREIGEFVHTKGGTVWWVRKDTGRPIVVTLHSVWLNALLSSVFGLNATELEQRYVIHELISYAKSLPISPDLQLLSFYDEFTQKLLLHTGGRDVLHVGADSVTTQPNGYGATTFAWAPNTEIWRPSSPTVISWHELLFEESLNHTLGIEKSEALAVLRSWFLFLLFRNIATTRPILAFFGAPGAGKTSTAKRLYRLIYGRSKNVSGLIDAEAFDMSVANNPFVCFDNLDSWEPWLPNKLALCASETDIEKRQLYTDSDMITMKRQALVCITAHNPRFTREDITDRLLLIMLRRIPAFKDETEFLESISRERNAIWSSIILDVQKILSTPVPTQAETPQFRISDFAHLGLWFARAHSPQMEQDFRSAISKITGGQRSFNLEEDQLLVSAIRKFVSRMESPPVFQQIGIIWNQLNSVTDEVEIFRRSYKNATQLGKKLMVMQPALKDYFTVEFQYDAKLGARTWKIGAKDVAN